MALTRTRAPVRCPCVWRVCECFSETMEYTGNICASFHIFLRKYESKSPYHL